jgi:hypothetical protein
VWNILRGDLEWSCVLKVDFLAVDRENAQFVVFSGNDKKSRSGVIMLMSPLSPQPLHYWHINHSTIKGIDFLPPQANWDGETSEHQYYSSTSSIVYMDEQFKINILQKDKLDETIFDKTLNQTPLSEGPTVFQQMYADFNQPLPPLEDDDETVKSENMEKKDMEIQDSQTPLSHAIKDLFSSPSHALPAPLLLYDTFMDRILAKKPQEDYSAKSKEISPQEEAEQPNSSGQNNETKVISLDEIERETIQYIQTLSQQKVPQSKDQYDFLVDFFQNNFSISEPTSTISVKTPQKVLPVPSPTKKRKLYDGQPLETTPTTEIKSEEEKTKKRKLSGPKVLRRPSSEKNLGKKVYRLKNTFGPENLMLTTKRRKGHSTTTKNNKKRTRSRSSSTNQ